jgi:monoamine oxidase
MATGAIVKVVVAYEKAFWRDQGFCGQVATDDDVVGLVLEDWEPGRTPMLLCFIEARHARALSGAPRPRAARAMRAHPLGGNRDRDGLGRLYRRRDAVGHPRGERDCRAPQSMM